MDPPKLAHIGFIEIERYDTLKKSLDDSIAVGLLAINRAKQRATLLSAIIGFLQRHENKAFGNLLATIPAATAWYKDHPPEDISAHEAATQLYRDKLRAWKAMDDGTRKLLGVTKPEAPTL